MKTNSETLIERFFLKLRAIPVDLSRQQYGFETRIMARLREREAALPSILAGRLMPYFSVGALVLGVTFYFMVSSGLASAHVNLLASSSMEYYEELAGPQ